jgi:hypothetical protein
MESLQWEMENHLSCRKVSFLTGHHCQFRGVTCVLRNSSQKFSNLNWAWIIIGCSYKILFSYLDHQFKITNTAGHTFIIGSLFVFCVFSFCHCIVCSSSIHILTIALVSSNFSYRMFKKYYRNNKICLIQDAHE